MPDDMKKADVVLHRDKDTKNTVRYAFTGEGEIPISTLYLNKAYLRGSDAPKRIRVTITKEENKNKSDGPAPKPKTIGG